LVISADARLLSDPQETALIHELADDLRHALTAIDNYQIRQQEMYELRKNEQKYRLLAEASQDLIFIFDLEKKLHYFNKSFQQLTGDDHLEIGSPVQDFFQESDLDNIVESLGKSTNEIKDNCLIQKVQFTNRKNEKLLLRL